MKTVPFLLASSLVALACACEKPRPQPPIVHVAPVEVVPFEDGYKAGFDVGEKAGEPRAKLPSPESIERIAHAEAVKNPDRDPKWERGFVAGYRDGFRKTSTGLK